MRLTFLLLFLLQACGQQQTIPQINFATAPEPEEKMIDPALDSAAEQEAQETSLPEDPIPIFVITCDRLTVLKKTLASFHKSINRPFEIVIHDNHSTFGPTVTYLDELENQGIKVYRHENIIKDEHMLDNVADTIKDWYKDHYSSYYAVTDPDIELEDGPGTILDVYAHLLDTHHEVNVVGPTLITDDLPDHYPFKEDEVRNSLHRWDNIPITDDEFEGQPYKYVPGAIDTTFGLYRSNYGFHRLNVAIQTFSPFAARHLDFYLDPDNLTDDQTYYMHHASSASHVGGPWMRDYIANKKQYGKQ